MVVSAAGAAVVSTGAVAVVSALSVVPVLPPQATKANAKPHTINNAITFFIVYRFLKFAAKIMECPDFKSLRKRKLFFTEKEP